MKANPLFPADFLWGVATSSYQIEGAAHEGGRGESIWDRFAYTPGRVKGGDTGDRACDHYHRFDEDIALMRELGVGAYRLSIAWPRLLPTGRERVAAAGLDFYQRLVEALLAANIEPVITLYHWDLPQPLEDAGGWPLRETAEAFVEFADLATRTLGDRVRRWTTINEPWCAAILGYRDGAHAPGRREPAAALAAAHHLLLAHGWALPVIRRNVPGAEVGIVLNPASAMPASPSPADHDLCRRVDGDLSRWFLDPLYGRGYPADMLADAAAAGLIGADGPAWLRPGDMAAIAAPTDYLGINYYTRALCRADEAGNAPRRIPPPPAEAHTDIGWEIYPDGLRDMLLRIHLVYRPERIYITENGAAYNDGPGPDGAVRDGRRVAYLRDHLRAAADARAAGVPLAGYFAWSLMDNFEWAEGFSQRFGLVHVDFATQRRTPKESFAWYQRLIATGAL